MKQKTPIYLDFDLLEFAEPVEQTVLQVKDLQKELLVLRLSFGQLKAAVSAAVQPVAAVLVPAITEAVRHATRLVTTLGQVIAGLLGVQVAQSKVEKTVISTGKAAKRTVAGFDQLNRLQGNTGGTSVSTQQVPVQIKTTLSPEVQQIVNRIKEMFAPLQEIDLTPLQWGFARLWEQVEKFSAGAAQVLGDLWQQVLVPFLGWVAESLVPVLLNLGTGTLKLLRVCLDDAASGFLQMLEDMRPLTEFAGEVVLTVLDQLRRVFADTRISAEKDGTALGNLFRTIGDAAAFLWERLGPTLENLRYVFATTFQSIGKTVADIMGFILDAISGAVTLICGILTGDWSRIWDGLKQICKNAVNGVIGVLNILLSALTGAVNSVFKLLNKVSIDVPDWVPGMGGKTFGFQLKELKAPQIPYLAKGAVLPANQPFLAMVGDQKHGTNIEAPLATIQEAVALTLEDFVQSNLAGHRATVEVLRQILEAVLGIHITDAALYQAVERYRGQRSVMLGTGR
jgi:hypothetical protein